MIFAPLVSIYELPNNKGAKGYYLSRGGVSASLYIFDQVRFRITLTVNRDYGSKELLQSQITAVVSAANDLIWPGPVIDFQI